MQGVGAVRVGSQGLSVKRGGPLQLSAAVQTNRFGEHASNIQTRQCGASPLGHERSLHRSTMLINLPRWKHRVAWNVLHVLTLCNRATRLFHIWQALSYLEARVVSFFGEKTEAHKS